MSKYNLEKLPKPHEGYIANGHGRLTCEHRRIAEALLGDAIGSMVVHHLNNNPQDNRITNLIVLPNAEHIKLHGYLTREYNVALDESKKSGKEFLKKLSKISLEHLRATQTEFIWLGNYRKEFNQCQEKIYGKKSKSLPCRHSADGWI